mgnify:CR=1 FL=1
MKIKVNNIDVKKELMQVPDLNFGQLQRWENHDSLNYHLEIDLTIFLDSIREFFTEFRDSEIEDNDPMDLEELISYKKLNWPTLDELVEKNLIVLSDLMKYHAYDVLHLILKEKLSTTYSYFYSVQSIHTFIIKGDIVFIKGLCFIVNRTS